MSLQTLQEQFIKQLTQFNLDKDFLSGLRATPALQPQQQVKIYQNNVRGALQNCLAQIYPVCQQIVGENYFKQLARIYIQDHPSQHSDLNQYGEAFPDFILSQIQQRKELFDFPYLSDLVHLEWLYHQVYYAAASLPFDFNAFAQLTEEQQAQSVFCLAPCLRYIASDYPIVSIWQMHQNIKKQPDTIEVTAENACVFRNQNTIEIFIISSEIFNLLQLIDQGKSLEYIVQSKLDSYLPSLIQQDWVMR